ncbi:hypothetical protein ABZV67_07955 [Streptomyces sp. NPDC005065]|uniref:hypothetical protein n=1 Tax=Streptomyces sp. NPDC005065 TaxID=3154461 RepID=UPI0033B5EF5B
MIEIRGGGGALSLTCRLDPSHSMSAAPWITCTKIYLGRDVSHLLIGDRRVKTPEQRKLITVWTCPNGSRGARPTIVALDGDGTERSRIGPHDSLDTHTWAQLREEP